MCGIVGIYSRDREARPSPSILVRMTDLQQHRGPDDGGVAMLGPVGLGHRRLSIVDLSPAGHQPMSTPGERYWITFNGEIYNFLSLREELEASGVRFRTRTDTEVLLQLYRQEGEACVERLNGMFAFAIYDRKAHTLFLARDRLGKKPLYLWDDGQTLRFASELKSFFADPAFRPTLEPTALVDYLCTLYVPDPRTIYREVTRLPPAHTLTVTAQGQRLRRYWQPAYRAIERWDGELRPGVEETLERFEALFEDAVRLRMMADVPLGAFLSGGVDSSAVVGAMQRLSNQPVKTCAIGFLEASEDESPYAREVATLLGTDHSEERVAADATGLLETLLWHFDEPFADASALPTWQLSQITRRRVTVALSGDGGDEAFGGYEKYAREQWERHVRRLLPPAGWRFLSEVAGGLSVPARGWRRGTNLLRTLADSPEDAYFRTQSFTTPEQVRALLSPELREAVAGHEPRDATRTAWRDTGQTDGLSRLQGVDIQTFLPGDILTKVDRMSMAHALEVRCPLLDHRLIELALSLPPSFRLYRGQGKRVLKASLERRLPARLVHRRKHGFTIPVDDWMRGPLRGRFREVVLEGGLRQAGLLDPRAVERVLGAHVRQEGVHGYTLWSLLVLGVWYDRIRGRAEPSSRPAAATTVVDVEG